MATGTDRTAPLREATPEAPIQTPEPTPTQEVDDRRAPMPANHQPLGWTDHGGMVEQQRSAMAWVKAGQQRRQNAPQEVEHDASVPEKSDGPRRLTFFEDNKALGRNYGELKAEHAENVTKEKEGGDARQEGQQRPLTFYEDHDHDHSPTR